jgi:hypothetical protein
MADEEEVKDFTNTDKKPDIPFKIDDDIFVAVGTAPGMAILDVSAVNKAENVDKIRIIFDFLDKVLYPDSAQLFADRLADPTKPIEIEQATSVAVWLMEDKYAKERPTEDPSPSANGSENTGPNSTDGAQATGSTPGTSTRLAP